MKERAKSIRIMKKVDRLTDCIAEERVEWVKDAPLHSLEYLLDDGLMEELLKLEANEEELGDEDREWFNDKRIGKWSDFRNSLTKKNLNGILE